MIVPKYWSESKAKTIANNRSFTIRRFGWSDVSEEDAKAHADQRLKEALSLLDKTGNVRKTDHKVSYNGGEGIPIREEVVSTHGDIVISRNSYGALCINTPDVMFADIDLDDRPPSYIGVIIFLVFAAASGFAALQLKSWIVLAVGIFAWMMLSGMISRMINERIIDRKGGLESEALERFRQVSDENPHLHMRIYKTPMGFRILFMEDTHNPSGESTLELLKSLNSDKLYIQMCRNQQCFRARVSPKPWRIGVDRLRPRPGVWPIKSEHLKERSSWIKNYDEKSKAYSACSFVTKLGSDVINPKAENVRKLHDDMCRAHDKNNVIA